MSQYTTPLDERNRQSLNDYKMSHNAQVENVMFTADQVNASTGEVIKVQKFFVRLGGKLVHCTEDTRKFMFDKSISASERLSQLSYVECKKAELPDRKVDSLPDDAKVMVEGKLLPNTNWFACIIKNGGTVTDTL